MCKNFKYILAFLVLLISFTSCQEIYEPNLKISNESLPVITGSITNKPGHHPVKLFEAGKFGSGTIRLIKDADISIISEKGPVVRFHHDKYEMYLPNSSIQGTPGETYFLTATLTNGNVLRSSPCTIPPPVTIDSVYATIDTRKEQSMNSYGDLIIRDVEGLQIYVDLISETLKKQYYKITKTIIEQSMFNWRISAYETIPVYLWKRIEDNELPNISASLSQNNKQKAFKQKTTFLDYELDLSTRTDTSSPVFQKGWVVIHYCEAIEESTFNYYLSIKEQLNASESIFDPVPSQIIGNMKCINNSEKLVLGNFEAKTVDTIVTAFYWKAGDKEFICKEPEQYKIPVSGGRSDKTKPDFWIDFE
jgi:hypothetical protein